MKKITNMQLQDLLKNSIITTDFDGINRIETIEQFNSLVVKPTLRDLLEGKNNKNYILYEWELKEPEYPIECVVTEMILDQSITGIKEYFSKNWKIQIKENDTVLVKALTKVFENKFFNEEKELCLIDEIDVSELIFDLIKVKLD